MLTKYGAKVLTKCLGLVVVIAVLGGILIPKTATLIMLYVFLAIITAFVLNFFRNPDRTPPVESGIVVAPADGKVVRIKDVFEPEFLKADGVQVSIFMSPLDVHVNRFPISGTVNFFRYVKGEYLVAFADKSSERNERTHIGVELNGYKILFKQIAGAVARRIVAQVAVGQKVKIGETFGMIQFGSRVDVIMPRRTNVLVKLNDRTVAGETILARFASGSRDSIH